MKRRAAVLVLALWSAAANAEARAEAPAEAKGPPPEPAVVLEAPPAAPAPPEPEKKWYQRVKLEGLADGYYGYRIQNPSTQIQQPNEFRAFDTANNTLTFAYAKLAVSLPAEPVGFRLDVGFGPVADLTAADIGAPDYQFVKNVLQLFVSAKLFGRLTVDVGKFVTSAGSEVVEAKENWLYSRSMLFAYGPYTHTGVRLSLPIGDWLTVQGGLVNGWDAILSSTTWRTFNLSGLARLASGTTVGLNLYAGPQNSAQVKGLLDLVVQQDLGRFSVNLNAAYGFERSSKWYGASLMGKVALLDKLRIAARLEVFGDPDGHRTGNVGSSYLCATLGAAYTLSWVGSLEIRPELRHDQALGASPYLAGTSPSQTTVQLALLLWL